MVVKLSDFLSTSFSTFSANDTNNAGVTYPGTVVHNTTLTPGVGIGAGIDFQVETSDNNTETGMRLEAVTTDVTGGSEDFDFVIRLMENGATASEKFRVTSTGVANALSFVSGANVVANNTTLRVGNTSFTTTNAIFGGTISANGGIGTAKQALVSSAGANAYWATLDMSFLPEASFKKAVRAATTADLGGVTATTTTLTATTLVALPAQDGITLIVGDRLLVKDQATPAQNGIYDVTNVGSAGVAAWVLTRSSDADTAAEVSSAMVAILSGTVNGGHVYDTDIKSTDTLGSTAMAWYHVVDTGGATFVGNVVMGTGSTGIYPASNTVGQAFGNTIARWNIVANNADFSSTVNAVTSVNSALLTVGTAFIANTTGAYHTGTMNAASFTTTGVRANTTGIFPTSNSSGQSFGNTISRWAIVANSGDFSSTVNAVTSVNSALLTVGALFTANSTLVNAAALNITNQINTATFFATTSANIGALVRANTTAYLISSNSTVNSILTATTLTFANTTATPFVANTTGLYHTGLVNAAAFTTTGNANAANFYAGANVYMNATTVFVSSNSTMNTIITANQITLNGANVMTTATTLKVFNSAGAQVFP